MGERSVGSKFGPHWLRLFWLPVVFGFTAARLSAAPQMLEPAGSAAVQGGHILRAAGGTLAFSAKDVDTDGGGDIPLSIQLPSAGELRGVGAEDGAFLLLRNLPEGVSVSAGMAMGRVWVVPLREVPALKLICPPGVAPFQLVIHLIGPNKRLLAETTIAVNLRPRQPAGATPTAADATKAPVQPQQPEAALTAQAEAVMLARGKDVLLQGGIAAARIIFEELAAHGSAAGALALAQSYDPAYAVKSAASAPAPDIAEARRWYERAAELGNADARRRLTEIASSR